MPKKSKLSAGKTMNANIIPTPWTRKTISSLCGGIAVKTVERRFGKMLRPAELRASCREKTYDPTRARNILIRHRVIPRPV